MSYERSVEILPAWDKRNSDPKKNYGIHSVDIKFLLKGKQGVVQFGISTGWFLPQNRQSIKNHSELYPLPFDIGYHSYVPLYEGQTLLTESCPYLDGKPCYYDGSGLQAEKIYEVMVAEGGEAMWKRMEEFYLTHFGKGSE